MNPITAALSVIPSWVWAIAVAALAATTGIQTVRVAGLETDVAQERQAHGNTRLQYAEASRKAEANARAMEQDLRNQIDHHRKVKQDEINSLRSDVRVLRKRLSDLPTRPATDPGAEAASFGQAPAGCPGPILYRDTAEALADEAERADLIRLELKACYAEWDSVRQILGGK